LVAPRVFEIETDRGWKTLADLLDPSPDVVPNPELVGLLRDAALARG
jgi:hypothetical protein